MNSHAPIKKPSNLDKSTSLRGILETTGIQQFIDIPDVTEVAINRPYEVFLESSKGWERKDVPNLSYDILLKMANSFAIFNSDSINIDNPIVSGMMPDGQRGQFMIPPSCEPNTVVMTVRRPSDTRFLLSDYQESGRFGRWRDVSTFTTDNTKVNQATQAKIEAEAEEIAELSRYLGIPDNVKLELFELKMLKAKADRQVEKFFNLAVKNKQNIVFVGGTGSGKTTITKSVCDLIPSETRLITIEDTPELDLPHHPNRAHLFYGDKVTPKALVKSCLRLKPDRILLTELRGDETWDYLSALNTGHHGSITTVHANDCTSAYYRIGSLIKQSSVGMTLDFNYIMKEVFTTIDVVAFMDRTYLTELSYNPVRKYRLLNGLETHG